MALVLEDGSAPEGANSYAAVETADAYHSARGNSTWAEASTSPDQGKTAALIRATTAIDAIYRARFPGTKANGRDQSLEWPRIDATDNEGEEIAEDEIPQEIVDAVCEAALRELVEAGSMMPDLERGGSVRRLKAGSVEIEYGNNASARTAFTIIDGILAGLLGAASSGYTATAVRG
jgi:hypothetical protein